MTTLERNGTQELHRAMPFTLKTLEPRVSTSPKIFCSLFLPLKYWIKWSLTLELCVEILQTCDKRKYSRLAEKEAGRSEGERDKNREKDKIGRGRGRTSKGNGSNGSTELLLLLPYKTYYFILFYFMSCCCNCLLVLLSFARENNINNNLLFVQRRWRWEKCRKREEDQNIYRKT